MGSALMEMPEPDEVNTVTLVSTEMIEAEQVTSIDNTGDLSWNSCFPTDTSEHFPLSFHNSRRQVSPMPTLFDQYKSMDRGSTKRFAAGGGKDTIKYTLIAAAKHPASQMATAMLIRDLLNFKVAQATDKKNTTDPERWLTVLPMHIAAVNNLRPKTGVDNNNIKIDLPDDLNEFYLRAFIANSSYVFQKQIPATFKALLVEVLKIPPVKGRLVDSYTAKFLNDNDKLISEAEVRPALIVGTRKRPTALEIKTFIEQLCHLPRESLYSIASVTFNEVRTFLTLPLSKVFMQCVVDWNRATIDKADVCGYSANQGWNIHVFKVLEFVKNVDPLSTWADLKENLERHECRSLWNRLANSGRLGQLPTTNKFNRLPNLTEPSRESWLVFLSGNQGLWTPSVFLVNEIALSGEKLKLGYLLNAEENKNPCALPGGWTDMEYMQIYVRWVQPLAYNVASRSFKLCYAYELYWVPQGIEQRNNKAQPLTSVNHDERTSFASQRSWWVILTLDIGFVTTNNTVITNSVGNYSWEVFDSKPGFPKPRWPIPCG